MTKLQDQFPSDTKQYVEAGGGLSSQCYLKHSGRDRGRRTARGRSKGPGESLKLVFAPKVELTDRGKEEQRGERETNAMSAATSDWGIDLRERYPPGLSNCKNVSISQAPLSSYCFFLYYKFRWFHH